MKPLLKTVVVDDNEILAEKFSNVVHQWEHSSLSGCFYNLTDTLAYLNSYPVDLLITDLNLPDGSGTTAIEAMSRLYPDGLSMVISALNAKDVVVKAIQAGAVGYLSKEDDSLNLIKSLDALVAGQSPISVNIARHIFTSLQPEIKSQTTAAQDTVLTSREIQILEAISKGYTYREIAKIYGVSHQTVPVHVRNIYRKLHVSNRSEATFEASRLGLINS